MGGNVSINRNNQVYKAEKIDLKKLELYKFRAVILVMFAKINTDFCVKTGEYLWDLEELLDGRMFNGSTSYILDPQYTQEEIVKYKPTCGDIDIVVPEERKKELFYYLKEMEGVNILDGTTRVTYLGSNKIKSSSIGNQINSIFRVDMDGYEFNCQVDFEFVPFEHGSPTQWAMFSHNSDFRDAKLGIKAVNHKYLIRALVGALSYRPDVAIATASSKLGNVTLSKSVRDREARMLKFSVGRGLREAYEPIHDENGKVLYMDGKYIYKMTDSKKCHYTTNIGSMVAQIFGLTEVSDEEIDDFNYFGGLVSLLAKYTSKDVQQIVHERYLHLLWKPENGRAQELEAGDAKADLAAKLPGYKHFVQKLQLEDRSESMIELYYSTYGQRK